MTVESQTNAESRIRAHALVKVRAFVLENYLYGAPDEELDDDRSFLETGVIDSTGVMELVLFLENEFGVEVKDTEFVPENLDSVNRVCAYLQRKLGPIDPGD